MTALTFPLPLSQFFDILPIATARFEPTEAIEISETADGVVLPADLGEALWQGEFGLAELSHDEALDIVPLINILRRAGGSFMASDPRRPWPRRDPGGVALAGHAPKLLAVGADPRLIRLSHLPAGYQLSRGDLLGFAYGTAPVRHALHEVVGPVTATGSGETLPFEVTPPVRPGAVPGVAIQLIDAACKAVLVPGSANTGTAGDDITSEMQIRWMQTLG